MADSFIQLPPDSTGKLIDTTSLTVGANTVQRERDNIADPTDPLGIARVENTDPGASDYGLVVRVAPSPNGFPLSTVDSSDAIPGDPISPTVLVVGAEDASGNAQTLKVATDGSLEVSIPATAVLPVVPANGPNGTPTPLLVSTSATTNDLLVMMINELRALRRMMAAQFSEDGTMQFNDFDPEFNNTPADEIRVN